MFSKTYANFHSAPGQGSTPPHKHGGANVIAYVLEGEVLSAMNDEEPKVYRPGDSWQVLSLPFIPTHVGRVVVEDSLRTESLDKVQCTHVHRINRYEPPGCRHRVSDNNSKTEKARFIATFVIKTEVLEKEGPGILVQIEPEYLAQV